eukprot:SAG31_NODE_694_length_12769_cov_8.102447_4_plen_94_part_00
MVRVATTQEDTGGNLDRLWLLTLQGVDSDRIKVKRRTSIVGYHKVRAFVGPYHAHHQNAAVGERDAVPSCYQQACVTGIVLSLQRKWFCLLEP